jgi:NAD(P)H dehydrogenase (quinone)
MEQNMTTAVTGATGQLGAQVVTELLWRGVAPTEIVAVVRDADKAADLAAQGVQVRVADYSDPAALRAALDGVDKLLLISGNDLGRRIEQHTNVIEAAELADVELIAYTSVLKADTSGLLIATEHLATELRLTASSIPTVFLRNGWYWENYFAAIPQAIESGKLFGAAGEGRIAGATRADFATAAAVVLTSEDHGGKVYELGGSDRITYAEFAKVISAASGEPVEYQDLPEVEYAAVLSAAGLPTEFATIPSTSDASIARGELDTDSGDLQKLIGRPSTPVADAIKPALG